MSDPWGGAGFYGGDNTMWTPFFGPPPSHRHIARTEKKKPGCFYCSKARNNHLDCERATHVKRKQKKRKPKWIGNKIC